MFDYQIGVFPVTQEGKVVLVTSRSGEYWIFPKGRRECDVEDYVVAGDEAYEEAGVLGKVWHDFKVFDVNSSKAPRLHVYPMQVEEVLQCWPEGDERERAIVSYKKAAKLLKKDLRAILHAMC